MNLWYGNFQALNDINLKVKVGIITSLIGPSGCGKTTFLRSINRINERLGYLRTKGSIDVIGNNIYGLDVNIVQLRKKIGMVFQRPNPLPVSIRDNVLYGYKLHLPGSKQHRRAEEDEIAENSLRQVLLWDSVKDH